jgi:hypothetical protein
VLVAKGGLSPLRADTIRKLAQAWLEAFTVAAKVKPADEPVTITVEKFTNNPVQEDVNADG